MATNAEIIWDDEAPDATNDGIIWDDEAPKEQLPTKSSHGAVKAPASARMVQGAKDVVKRGYLDPLANMSAGFLDATAGVGEKLINAGQRVSESVGAGRIKFFDEAVAGSKNLREKVSSVVKDNSDLDPSSITGQIYQGLGAVPAAAVEWNPAVTAASAYSEGGIGAVPQAVAERALMGGALGMVHNMPGGETGKRLMSGALMGAHGYGKTGDIEGSVANAALGTMMPAKKSTAQEAGAKMYENKINSQKTALNTKELLADALVTKDSPDNISRKYARKVSDQIVGAFPGLGGEAVNETIRAYGDVGAIARAVKDIRENVKQGNIRIENPKTGGIETKTPSTYDDLFQIIPKGKEAARSKYEAAKERLDANPEANAELQTRLKEISVKLQEVADTNIDSANAELKTTGMAALNAKMAWDEVPITKFGQAQDAIKQLNEFVEGSDFTETQGVKAVSNLKVQELRKILTDISMKYDGPEWKTNRDLYGGYKALEMSVVPMRNLIIEGNTSPGKGKILTPTAAGEIMVGGLTGRSALVGLGLANAAISEYRASGKKVDKRIENTFKEMERQELVEKAIGRRKAQRTTMPDPNEVLAAEQGVENLKGFESRVTGRPSTAAESAAVFGPIKPRNEW